MGTRYEPVQGAPDSDWQGQPQRPSRPDKAAIGCAHCCVSLLVTRVGRSPMGQQCLTIWLPPTCNVATSDQSAHHVISTDRRNSRLAVHVLPAGLWIGRLTEDLRSLPRSRLVQWRNATTGADAPGPHWILRAHYQRSSSGWPGETRCGADNLTL